MVFNEGKGSSTQNCFLGEHVPDLEKRLVLSFGCKGQFLITYFVIDESQHSMLLTSVVHVSFNVSFGLCVRIRDTINIFFSIPK